MDSDVIEKRLNEIKEQEPDRLSMENDEEDDFFKTKAAKKLIKCFCLSITYASTIGGTASLIGIFKYNLVYIKISTILINITN
jgi:hypothetical protein